jgi:2-polyprenyl-3-methyl-5-hydroxy-6-metoxy-1,4-benzoquinol methylase
MTKIKSLTEASVLVHDAKFERDKWIEAYTYTSQYNPWSLEKIDATIKQKSLQILGAYTSLETPEGRAEVHFPFSKGKVLELGANVGRFAIYKVLNFPELSFICIDASTYIHEIASQHEQELGLSDRIERRVMLAEQLEFDDNVFDRVYAFDTLEHVGDLNRSLFEINRVLKPGCDFIFEIPFLDYKDSGFHSQRHNKEKWLEMFSKYFKIGSFIYFDGDLEMIGQVFKSGGA